MKANQLRPKYDNNQKFFGSFFQKRTHFLGLGITILCLLCPVLHLPGSIWAGALWRKDAVLALLAAAACLYAVAVYVALRYQLPKSATYWIAGLAVATRLLLLPSAPFMSSDVYRYVWDGRVQQAGYNPYLYVANDPALAKLREPDIYPKMNRLDYAHTIYPPAAQIVYWAADLIGYNVTATKFLLFLLEAAGMAALWRVLVLAGLPTARLLIYAWNPLAIWSFAADGHVDAAVVGFLGLTLLARFTSMRTGGRPTLAGILLGWAILVKFLPLVVAPALWRRWNWTFPVACLLTIAALYACYIGAGWQVLGFLLAYTHEEGMAQGSGFWLLSLLDPFTTLPHWSGKIYILLCAFALAGAAAWMVFRQKTESGPVEIRRVIGNAGILAGGTMLAMSPHYSWYFPWLAMFATVVPWRSLIYLSCAPLILYADPYHATLIIPSLVFAPALVLLVFDAKGKRFFFERKNHNTFIIATAHTPDSMNNAEAADS